MTRLSPALMTISTALCALVLSTAQTSAKLEEFTHDLTAVSGQPLRLGFFTNIDPECVATGTTTVRIVKPPKHGTTEVETTVGFANYPKDNVRSACNAKKVDGVTAVYTSTEQYTGKDTLDVEVIFPSGGYRKYHYIINVK